jgi:SPP1 family predicted phage head-tail adaptor
MQAGKLDRRILIENKTSTRNSVGGNVETWSTLAERWASHRELGAKAAISGNEKDRLFYGEGDTIFVIRYDDLVDANMRITYNGKIYAIEAVREFGTGRQVFMEIIANSKN